MEPRPLDPSWGLGSAAAPASYPGTLLGHVASAILELAFLRWPATQRYNSLPIARGFHHTRLMMMDRHNVSITIVVLALGMLSSSGMCGAAPPSPPAEEHHKYCIVGAGPAGVQLGHYLHLASRDYVTLDRAPKAASWFSKFPIHRQLNSINRRYTRSGHPSAHS